MCIACELGYWSMVDALDAERDASKKKAARADDADFACEPCPPNGPNANAVREQRQSADEPTP